MVSCMEACITWDGCFNLAGQNSGGGGRRAKHCVENSMRALSPGSNALDPVDILARSSYPIIGFSQNFA